MNNKKIIQLISLSKDFNSLLDKGEALEINDLYRVLQHKMLFQWIIQRFDKQINLNKITKSDLKEIEEQFLNYSILVEPEDLGIESNALNLLIAYCLMLMESILKEGN